MRQFNVCLFIVLSIVISACQSARRVDLESGEVSGGEANAGEINAGEVNAGEVNAGEVNAGEVNAGEVNAGELTGGEISGGEMNVEGALESLKPALKRKDYRQLSSDLSSALELESNELCNELGNFPCLSSVHRLALGGIAPETQSIYFPTQLSSVSAPIALERVVYAACGVRIKKDFINQENAKIFKLELDQNNALSNVNDPKVTEMLNKLFQRALLREGTEAEIQGLLELYELIATAPNAQRSGQFWAWASCLAIFTSAEFIFY